MGFYLAKTISYGTHAGTYGEFVDDWSFHVDRVRPAGRSDLEVSVNNNYGGNNPFLVRRARSSGGTVTGKYCPSRENSGSLFTTYPLNLHYGSDNPGADFYVEPPDVDRMLAAMNPYRPTILATAAIVELRELPSMIRDLGRLKLGRPIYKNSPVAGVSQDWVNLNFGWTPLLMDLQSMIDIGLDLDKRQKELDRLYSGPGLRRSMKLPTMVGPAYENSDAPPGSIPWKPMSVSGNSTCTQWVMARMKPAHDPSTQKPVDRPSALKLKRILAGFSGDGAIASAWELMPWSWLIDYSYGIGNFIQAHSNGHLFTVERIAWMRHYQLKVQAEGQSYTDNFRNTVNLSAFRLERETLYRTPLVPSSLPNLRFPVLSGKQLSILGSLIALRTKALKR